MIKLFPIKVYFLAKAAAQNFHIWNNNKIMTVVVYVVVECSMFYFSPIVHLWGNCASMLSCRLKRPTEDDHRGERCHTPNYVKCDCSVYSPLWVTECDPNSSLVSKCCLQNAHSIFLAGIDVMQNPFSDNLLRMVWNVPVWT